MLNSNLFVERDCKVDFNGQSFESGGAYILPCTDGKLRGMVYVNQKKSIVADWHGNEIARLDTFTKFRGNYCQMVKITFTLSGVKFIGLYCDEWCEVCKVWSTKPVR